MSALVVAYSAISPRHVAKHVSALSPGDEFEYRGSVFCVLHVIALGRSKWGVVVLVRGLASSVLVLEFGDSASLHVTAERKIKIEVL